MIALNLYGACWQATSLSAAAISAAATSTRLCARKLCSMDDAACLHAPATQAAMVHCTHVPACACMWRHQHQRGQHGLFERVQRRPPAAGCVSKQGNCMLLCSSALCMPCACADVGWAWLPAKRTLPCSAARPCQPLLAPRERRRAGPAAEPSG